MRNIRFCAPEPTHLTGLTTSARANSLIESERVALSFILHSLGAEHLSVSNLRILKTKTKAQFGHSDV